MRKFSYVPVAFTVAAVMLTAACGSSRGTEATTTGSAERAVSTNNGAQPSQAGRLSVWKSEKLGQVVTDGAGFTLYRFDKDTAKPPASNCTGDCAASWPPVLADGAKAGRGMDPGLLGSVKRADGTKQLTLAGWPLYRYAEDTAPRQTRGQGVGGTWFAAAPDGTKAKAQAQEAPGEPNDLPALSTVDDKERGTIVRDGKGRTLYRFTKDTAWPMKSNCEGACLEKWKPAELVDKKNIKGIDPKLIIPYTRPDGTKQLTIDCWPLYWYTGDKKPGDTNGQGVNGTWFTVRPDGKLAK
ncbi:SCO0930 family lipoprotein [Streptomyces sp. NPDC057486]|uniref:SCO0930 family lipoprotein n=1 Tax=Streptomyces sp. NPDC057486 TaxID=3346145 RepID=UPI00369B0F39